MTTALAQRATDAPLPTGISYHKIGGGSVGSVAWPPADNFLYPGTGPGGDTIAFNRPERFWLKAGASIIANGPAAWARYDYGLELVANGVYGGTDLNGIAFFQKANALGGGTTWWGASIESLWFCEANTNYVVDLVSKGNGAGCTYYQATVHWNLWAYTIGEGVY